MPFTPRQTSGFTPPKRAQQSKSTSSNPTIQRISSSITHWTRKVRRNPSSCRRFTTTTPSPISSVPPARNRPSTKSRTASRTSSTFSLRTAFTSSPRSSRPAALPSAKRKSHLRGEDSGNPESPRQGENHERTNSRKDDDTPRSSAKARSIVAHPGSRSSHGCHHVAHGWEKAGESPESKCLHDPNPASA